jgi:FAR-17a/AIG1-like protein
MLYWSIHFYDRTLLVDPKIAPQLPPLDDMGFHLFPTLLLMVDTLFFSPPWETHALSALMYFSVFGFGYWMWVEHCFTHNKFYPYPLLQLLDSNQRALLFTFATLLCWSSFLTVRSLYRIVNGEIQAHMAQNKKDI